MRTISSHVSDVIEQTPLLAEVLSEGIGNASAIARLIKKQVEKRAFEEVSEHAIAMALHRMPKRKRATQFGFRYLRRITDVTLRSNLTLVFVHNVPNEKKIFSRVGAFEEKHPGSIFGVTKGLVETLLVAYHTAAPGLKKLFGHAVARMQSHVSSVTMRLPSESMPIPGVYYPILKALAWEGINVVELVSAGTELTVFVEDNNAERALKIIRDFTRADS